MLFSQLDCDVCIPYIYDASEVKQKKVVHDASLSSSQSTYYAGNYIYKKGSAQSPVTLTFFNSEEGYIEPVFKSVGVISDFDYVYQYKDHLGNIRLSYQDMNNDGSINPETEIKEENHYYPFGLKHKGYNNQITGRDHQYGYNGKEEQNELSLNWSDYGARNYDASIGRWMNLDPLAEKYYSISPMTFVVNSPILLIDPDGRWVPGVDENGNIYLKAEEGDNLKSLYKYFGGKENASKYLNKFMVNEKRASTLKISEGLTIKLNPDNIFSKTMKFYHKNKENIDGKETYDCKDLCISTVIKEEAKEDTEGTGSSPTELYNFGKEWKKKEKVEEKDLIFGKTFTYWSYTFPAGDHAAVFFGKDKEGNKYYFSKNGKKGKLTIMSEKQLKKVYNLYNLFKTHYKPK